MVSEGDKVRVREYGGEYIAKVLNADEDLTDPDGERLYCVKVVDMIDSVSYDLAEGEACNVHGPSIVEEL